MEKKLLADRFPLLTNPDFDIFAFGGLFSIVEMNVLEVTF